MVRVLVLVATLVLSLIADSAYAYDGNVPGGQTQEPIWGAPLGLLVIAGAVTIIIGFVALIAQIVRYEHNLYEHRRRNRRR